MIIYTNGCSHTRGTPLSLNNDLTQAWPYLVSRHYGCKLDNDSIVGSSNDSIVKRTIEYVLTAAIPPSKVFIQFTVLDRFDTAGVTHFPRSSVKGDHVYNIFYGDMFPRTKEVDNNLSRELLNQMYMLQCFLIEHGIADYRFIVWSAVDSSYITYKHINKSRVIFNTFNHLQSNFELCNTPDPSRGGKLDGHFGPDAHRQIFNWIIGNYHVDNTEESDYNFIDHIY
jgi:hypothetical protein